MSVQLPRLLLWLLHWHCLVQRTSTTGSNQNQTLPLPPDWDVYCPYTDFCTHKASHTTNLTTDQGPVLLTVNGPQKPCCEACSCEPDCGLKRNCCTYAMDKHRLDEQDHITCSVLSTVQTLAGKRTSVYYLTVDKCLDQSRCDTFKTVPWGSMYPVVSMTTGMIYLNEKCANCNGDFHTQHFTIEVNCQMINTYNSYVSGGVRSAFDDTFSENEGCYLRFLPPANVDLFHMTCSVYSKPINRCKDGKASIDMQNLCASFNSTFVEEMKIFANVYCRLCYWTDSPSPELPQYCARLGHDRSSDVLFSFVLNENTLSDLINHETETSPAEVRPCSSHEMMERESHQCRRFHCPEGQILIERRCSFISLEWTAGPFVSYLRLEPNTQKDTFPINQLEHLASYRGKFFKIKLRSWWRKLYYREAPENATNVPYFVLMLVHKKKQLHPKPFINNFKKSLKSVWQLRFSGQTYHFKAALHNSTRYFSKSPSGTRIIPWHVFANRNWRDVYYEELTAVRPSTSSKILQYIPFTNAFLCKQVELLPEEYVDHGTSVFLKVTNCSLGMAEFRKSRAGEGQNETISACAEFFGPDFWYRGSADNCHVSITVLCMVLSLCGLFATFD